ncbi:PREDICTED: lysosomal Pro-X carboxypeptidase-like [Nelumbo nucifera]|uniref:Lysosomal Pro-X carboxypeptidase-like n=2 Tax=Nelumbo nucifera TaxID=4432 RepID=A0A1U8AI51_NELNU|nr:PREDICTED: lysosomal Pro-X carboxypeptidase-like [Nelumbo nucifera]DAD48745.1 TPA_asm: hypothetical protein HUJ06_018682 [Nelumbo nucifera]
MIMAVHSKKFSVHWFPPLLLLFVMAFLPATQSKMPNLDVFRKSRMVNPSAAKPSSTSKDDLQTFFYTQTLDHFNYRPESYTTFQQRYMINFKYWGGVNSIAPIFVFLGEESSLDDDIESIGFLTDHAPRFNALIVYIEHRYYGKSVPFESWEKSFQNTETLGYFNSAQALADYAEVIIDLKKNLSAEFCPVIVMGGSYGGMLASWFRLKYPHVALGALASSAPILYFDDITPHNGYYSIVTKDYREASESCHDTIRESWSEIDKVASQADGLSVLSQKFKTCSPLNTSFELKDYLDSIYAETAQFNRPPENIVNKICDVIDGAPKGTDILSRVFAGVVAYMGNRSCYDTNYYNYPTQGYFGWRWQTCSELVMPIGRGSNDTMFPSSPFDLKNYTKSCQDLYGVPPRPHWITTQFGGHDIRLVLQKFASNIIFSNGLKDPYSSGGVLANISDSIVAIYTNEGSHCMDLYQASAHDPKWLVMQRQLEIETIKGWIEKYYVELAAANQDNPAEPSQN